MSSDLGQEWNIAKHLQIGFKATGIFHLDADTLKHLPDTELEVA